MAQDTFSKNETLVGFWDSCFVMTDEMREEIKELASHDWKEMAPAQKLADAVAALGKCRKVVDYGCGTGWASIGAAKSGCADVKAVEVSENGARATAVTVRAFGVADRVRTLRVTPNWLLGEPSEEYDGIVCSNVLDVVRSTYLWDFSQEPPFDHILYAVWSTKVTVTFDIVYNGSNLHVWQGPGTTATPGNYVFYRSSNTSGTITYSLAKGDYVPQPDDPSPYNNPSPAWRFVKWLEWKSEIDSLRKNTKKPTDTNIVSNIFDFSKRIVNDVRLMTSWTTDTKQHIILCLVRNHCRILVFGRKGAGQNGFHPVFGSGFIFENGNNCRYFVIHMFWFVDSLGFYRQ